MTDYPLQSDYDNAGAVAETPQFIARWAERSRALRTQRPQGLDIPYGEGERRRLDLFAAPARDAPCFVFIHGGYWQRNSREGFACMAEAFLSLGWSAALPSHTLAPDASMTEIAAELRAALDKLGSLRAASGASGPVVLSGWSAGGHLAALLADHPLVDVAAPISGVFDLDPIRQTRFDIALKLSDREIETFSPMRRAATPKPHLIFVGAGELAGLRGQSRDFRRHRGEAATDGYYEIAGRHHFDVLDDLMSADGVISREIVRAVS